MTVLDAPTRNGADLTAPAQPADPSPAPQPAPLPAPASQEPVPPATPESGPTADEVRAAGARQHALWFFWGWLLFATVVSIGGNVIHAWMTAPLHLKLLAALAAAVIGIARYSNGPNRSWGCDHSHTLSFKDVEGLLHQNRRSRVYRFDAVPRSVATTITLEAWLVRPVPIVGKPPPAAVALGLSAKQRPSDRIRPIRQLKPRRRGADLAFRGHSRSMVDEGHGSVDQCQQHMSRRPLAVTDRVRVRWRPWSMAWMVNRSRWSF